MRRVYSSERFRRLTVVGILLTTAVLATGIAACEDAGSYQLGISSTPGGSVSVPGEGTFTYKAGSVLQLVATPDDGDSEFLMWTGDTGQIANRYSASTTITMNGNYSVVATFGTEGEGGGPIRP